MNTQEGMHAWYEAFKVGTDSRRIEQTVYAVGLTCI
jgi:hypothetical protein